MNNIILLNGAPMVGKDVIAEEICRVVGNSCELIEPHHIQFKKRLFDIALSIAGINSDVWFERYNNRELKEKPWDRLPVGCGPLDFGMHHTQRSWLVEVSEDIIKPAMGKRFFGKAAAQEIIEDQSCDIMKLSGWSHLHVFSDSGFPDEVIPLFEIPNTSVHLIRLTREGCSFDGDSRNYLKGDYRYATVQYLINDKGIGDIAKEILHLVNVEA